MERKRSDEATSAASSRSRMRRLSLGFLGPFRICRDGSPLESFEYDHVRALLAYLAVEHGRVHARDFLAALLWPERPDRNGRQNLRQALARLRHAIGDRDAKAPLLDIRRDSVRMDLGPHVDLDVALFTDLLAACDRHAHESRSECEPCAERLEHAVDLYRGRFLDGFAFGDRSTFEEWAVARRQHLDRMALGALASLSDYHAQRGDAETALRYAFRQLELEPWREEAHRQVMRTLAASGERSAALAHFEVCRTALLEELGVKPSAETVALNAQIRDSANPAGARAVSRRLPTSSTALVGRDEEVRQIKELVLRDDVRLLTLTGPPGIGKTRLAMQVAAELAAEFADGVHYVSLAPLADPELVVSAVARALGLRESGRRPLRDAVADALRERHVLLVVDNFEHVVAAAPLIAQLLAAAPRLTVLATSRVVLYLQAEHDFVVPPLAVPELALPADQRLLECAAVRLFGQRARAADARFDIQEHMATVAAICRRLAGVPLAIELAAVRVRLLPPSVLLERLDSQLALLSSGPRDLPQRQQSLRHAVAWSYDLLSPSEQRLLRLASVFVGGCTLEAVEAVEAVARSGNEGNAVPDDVLGNVAALVDQSLLQRAEQPTDEARFGMLEMIREFAQERLIESGELAAARERHARFYADLAARGAPALEGGPDQLRWFRRLAEEQHNLRSALRWCLEHDREAALRLANALGLFWIASGMLSDGRAALEAVLADADGAPSELLARASWLAGWLALLQSDVDRSARLHESGLNHARAAGDAGAIARALAGRGDVALERGDVTGAAAAYEEGLDWARKAGDRWARLLLLWQLGSARVATRDYARVREHCRECLNLAMRAEENLHRSQALYYLGGLSLLGGDAHAARLHLEEGLTTSEQRWSIFGGDHLAEMLGRALLAEGDTERARHLVAASLNAFRRAETYACMAHSFEAFARLALVQGQPERSARLLGVSETCLATLDVSMRPIERALYDQTLQATQAELGEHRFGIVASEGRTMSLEAAIAFAIDVPGSEAARPPSL